MLAVNIVTAASCVPYMPPPQPRKPIVNSVVVAQPFEETWSAAIPAIGQSFFVINNLSKDSGFINISYSGEPSGKVDCSQTTPYCKPAEFLEAGITTNCLSAPPTMNVRMNLVFTKESEQSTRINVNVRYFVTLPFVDDQAHPISAETQFTTNDVGSFTVPGLAGATCSSTGRLENTLMQLLSSATPPPGSRVSTARPATPAQKPSEGLAGIGVVVELDPYARVSVKSVLSGS
ncbi:MAG: hypothetical protein ACREJX_12115, partial [Polyangiaceae bacterium]